MTIAAVSRCAGLGVTFSVLDRRWAKLAAPEAVRRSTNSPSAFQPRSRCAPVRVLRHLPNKSRPVVSEVAGCDGATCCAGARRSLVGLTRRMMARGLQFALVRAAAKTMSTILLRRVLTFLNPPVRGLGYCLHILAEGHSPMFDSQTTAILRAVLDDVCQSVSWHETATRTQWPRGSLKPQGRARRRPTVSSRSAARRSATFPRCGDNSDAAGRHASLEPENAVEGGVVRAGGSGRPFAEPPGLLLAS